MSRSQRALRFRDGVDYRGQTAASQNEPCKFTPEQQRDIAIAKGFAVGPAPLDTDRPAITGTLMPGSTLTCSAGDWDSSGTDTISYQWLRGNTPQGAADTINTYALSDADAGFPIACRVGSADSIAGADENAYTIVAEDSGASLYAIVTATDVTGSTLALSDTVVGA